jgi:hypothetical protein
MLDFSGKVFIPEAPQLDGTVGGASIVSLKGLDVIWMKVPSFHVGSGDIKVRLLSFPVCFST